MTVRVLPHNHSREDAGRDFVRVSTCSDPADDTVTLATIERVVQKRDTSDSDQVLVRKLVTRQPMTADAAVGLATSYAARKHIDVVYTDN